MATRTIKFVPFIIQSFSVSKNIYAHDDSMLNSISKIRIKLHSTSGLYLYPMTRALALMDTIVAATILARAFCVLTFGLITCPALFRDSSPNAY